MSSSCVIMLSFYFPEALALSLSSDTIPGRIKLVRTRRWNWNRRSSQLSLVFGTLCCRPRQAAATDVALRRYTCTPILFVLCLCLPSPACFAMIACILWRVACEWRPRKEQEEERALLHTYPKGPNLAIIIVAMKIPMNESNIAKWGSSSAIIHHHLPFDTYTFKLSTHTFNRFQVRIFYSHFYLTFKNYSYIQKVLF